MKCAFIKRAEKMRAVTKSAIKKEPLNNFANLFFIKLSNQFIFTN
jgi:hypothetical protein